MTNPQTAKTTHQDNLFGVCNALGEDFGFNPLWLRLALCVAFLFKPEVVVMGYFAVGAVVLATRLAFPKGEIARPAVPAPAVIAADNDEIVFARAA